MKSLKEGQKGVAIITDAGTLYHYHGWFQDRLDDSEFGSMSDHAEEILSNYAPNLSSVTFRVFPCRYIDGEHLVNMKAFCGRVHH